MTARSHYFRVSGKKGGVRHFLLYINAVPDRRITVRSHYFRVSGEKGGV
jgi:hypothetical protein